MSFLDRIRECNEHDLSQFKPFYIEQRQVGWVRHDMVERLADYPDVFEITPDTISLNPRLDCPELRSTAIKPVLEALRGAGVIPAWRDEIYPVTTSFGGEPLLQMERAAFPCLGIRAYGVHINGFVANGPELKMWIARRSATKSTCPGKLDNMVAGGLPIGISLEDNVVKECHEEAGIPASLASRAIRAGSISYCKQVPEGLKPDVQFVCDLELPYDFEPRPVDGEVEAFYLWPIDRVMDVVSNTTEFKFNCNLVIIDFLMRRGFIAPEHQDYQQIIKGLR